MGGGPVLKRAPIAQGVSIFQKIFTFPQERGSCFEAYLRGAFQNKTSPWRRKYLFFKKYSLFHKKGARVLERT